MAVDLDKPQAFRGRFVADLGVPNALSQPGGQSASGQVRSVRRSRGSISGEGWVT